jgi:Bacterial HORMA domain family 1
MSATSYSFEESTTFSIVHARHMAAKVATDLLRLQRFYGEPTNASIDAYEAELIALLKQDYLQAVTYGFKRNEKWVVALRYHAVAGGSLVADDDPGKLKPGVDVSHCSFGSFLEYNAHWSNLNSTAKQTFRKTLPFQRSDGTEPGVEAGYWVDDRTYAAGGRAISRSVIKRY